MFTPSNYTLTERFLWNFYIVDVEKVSVHDGDKVPDFLKEMMPIFIIGLILENIGLYLRGKPFIRLNDGMTSFATGMMMTLFRILPLGIEFIGYKFLYQYRFFNPDYSSPWTWWYTAVVVDFCYYWVHRMSHEVNILWAIGHHVHHSSEDYNLTTAVRQPAFLKFLNHGLYHPLALFGVPLHVVLVHLQFSLIYQFWIHTEVIDNIGPLEWILNTASHHRVHHGMNNWCLDKNYGSFFIIWDKIFGTFQAEKKDEKIVYGLVDQPQTFEPIYLQTFYAKMVIKKAVEWGSVTNFLKGILYGPAWYPGSSRLGDEPDMTAKVERKKYNPSLPWHINLYIYAQFAITALIYLKFLDSFVEYSMTSVVIFSIFIFWTLFIMGSLLNGHYWIARMEIARCILAAAFLDRFVLFGYNYLDTGLIVCFGLSSIFWIYITNSSMDNGKIKHN